MPRVLFTFTECPFSAKSMDPSSGGSIHVLARDLVGSIPDLLIFVSLKGSIRWTVSSLSPKPDRENPSLD